jgi:hypothetical protein
MAVAMAFLSICTRTLSVVVVIKMVVMIVVIMVIVPVIIMFVFPALALPALFFPARFPVSPVMLPVMRVVAFRAPDKHRLRRDDYRLRGNDNGGLANEKGCGRRGSSAYVNVYVDIVSERGRTGQQTYYCTA